MKTIEDKKIEMVKVPKHGLLTLVASKLKERQVLFPDKVEKAKEYLRGSKFVNS